jgi:hypothetical protein
MRFICNSIAIRLFYIINDSLLQLSEDYQTFIKR